MSQFFPDDCELIDYPFHASGLFLYSRKSRAFLMFSGLKKETSDIKLVNVVWLIDLEDLDHLYKKPL